MARGHRRAEGLLGDVLAAGSRAAAAGDDAVLSLGFAATALGLASEEACQAALASPEAAALLCCLLQARGWTLDLCRVPQKNSLHCLKCFGRQTRVLWACCASVSGTPVNEASQGQLQLCANRPSWELFNHSWQDCKWGRMQTRWCTLTSILPLHVWDNHSYDPRPYL